MTQFVLFGGKGGVGKTTCASSTAISLALDGRKTMLISTDPAHSVGDVFEQSIGGEETRLSDEYPLFAKEVDPEERYTQNYKDTIETIFSEASALGLDMDSKDFSAFENGMIGSDELAVLDLFAEYDDSEWDCVVFDTAPTGHTLRMLNLPQILDSVVGTAIDIKSKFQSVTGAVSGVFRSDNDDKKRLSDIDVKGTKNKLKRVGEILTDSDKTGFYAVMEAEQLSLEETVRLESQLESYDIDVRSVFVNKLLTDINPNCDMCSSQYESQQDILEEAQSRLNVPLLKIEKQETPPRAEDLEKIARNIDIS